MNSQVSHQVRFRRTISRSGALLF